MNKLIISLLTIIFLISSAFAFDITDSNDVAKTYFSLNDFQVKVTSNIVFDNFSVYYTLINNSNVETYNFDTCGSKVCKTFSLASLIQNTNQTFVGSKIFTINVGSENRTVYLDLEKPSFNLTKKTLNTSLKKLFLEFNYSDNSNQIDKIELIKLSGNTQTIIANLTKLNEYTYNLNSSGNLSFKVRILDISGNEYTTAFSVLVPDFFEPTLSIPFLQYKDEKYKLYFSAEDTNLSKYEIVQDDLSLSKNITGNTKYSGEVDLPFTTGSIVLKVFDVDGNYVSKTITLDLDQVKSSINYAYTNEKLVSVNAPFANVCNLVSVDGNSEAKQFSTMSNHNFQTSVGISDTNKDYTIEYHCENDNYRVYFSNEFTYDTKAPENVEVELEKTNNGEISASWSQSKDDLSQTLTYKLFRDGDKIYEGENLDFLDDEVIFPNEYSYYVQIFDQAGNYVTSSEKSIVPKKVGIKLQTNLAESQVFQTSNYNFKIDTEKGANVLVKVIDNKGNEIYSNSFASLNGETINVPINFNSGLNEVRVKTTDEFGTIRDDIFYVTYDAPVVAQIPKVVETIVEPVVEEIVPEKDSIWTSLWLLVPVIIVLVVLFYLFFVYKSEPEIRHGRYTTKKTKTSFLDYVGRSKDSILTRDLYRIKKNRIKRQEERKRIEEKNRLREENESSRGSSRFNAMKMRDLAKSSQIRIPFDVRDKSKKRSTRIRREVGSSPTIERPTREKKEFFSSEDKKKDDPFSSYLRRIKSTPTWGSRDEYNASQIEKKRIQDEIQRKEEEHARVAEVKMKSEKDGTRDRRNNEAKLNLDDYLKRKGTKKGFFFAEKAVDRDIDSRKE